MNLVRILFFAIFLMLTSGAVFAKGSVPVFFGWGGDSFYKVADLPDTYEYQYNDHYVDIGVVYKGITIFFVPIWQYDIRYVGVIPNNDESYYEFSEDEIRKMAQSANISIPPLSQVKLDFWTAWGGKIVLGLIIALFLLYNMLPAKRETD